jgi:hypothetical protein
MKTLSNIQYISQKVEKQPNRKAMKADDELCHYLKRVQRNNWSSFPEVINELLRIKLMSLLFAANRVKNARVLAAFRKFYIYVKIKIKINIEVNYE